MSASNSSSSNLNNASEISIDEQDQLLTINAQDILQNVERILAKIRAKYSRTANQSQRAINTGDHLFYQIEITQFKLQNETTIIENRSNIVTSSSNWSNGLQNEGRHRIEIRIKTSNNNHNDNNDNNQIMTKTMEIADSPNTVSSSSVSTNEQLQVNKPKRRILFDDVVIVINDTDFPQPSPFKRIKLEESEIDLKCSICMENSGENIPTSTPCGHIFCKKCIIRAHKRLHQCPLCKEKFRLGQLEKLHIS